MTVKDDRSFFESLSYLRHFHPLTMNNGPVIGSLEPRDRRTVNRRKDDREKPLTSTSTDVKEGEAGLKGNRRGGGNAAKYCRKLGIGALLAYMIGGPIIFLDSRGYISIPFINLADPKTVDTIEQKTGMKIISLKQYGGLTKELKDSKAKIAEKEKELAALAAKKAEPKEDAQFKVLNEAYAQFCGECKWKGRISCEGRKAYMISNHGSSEEAALANMLKEPQCQKSVERKEEPQFCGDCKWARRISCEARKAYLVRRGSSEETALANMLKEPKCQKSVERRLEESQFCGDCKWARGISCQARKAYLIKRGSSDEIALASMLKEPKCQKSVQRRLESPQFCGECKWASGISCEARMAFLINHYGNSEETALSNMLKEPKCQKSMERRLRAGRD